MKISGKGTTVAGETYLSLRQGILSGQLRPGDRIRTQELCERFAAGLGAIRESLSQLMAEGLVLSEAHRGYTVAPISTEDLKDLTRLRIEIERLCLQWSIESGSLEWESEVVAASHRLTKTFRATDRSAPSPQWVDAHDAYHSALVSACGSPRLLRLRRQLYEQSERYRKLEIVLVKERDADDEHRRITDAAVARDAALATRLMAAHISLTTDNILRAMEKKAGSPSRAKSARQADARDQRVRRK